MNAIDTQEAITQAYHDQWARVVASLTRRLGDLDIAEEATANRKAIDRIRRENKRDDKQGRPRCCTTTTRPSLSAPMTTAGSG